MVAVVARVRRATVGELSFHLMRTWFGCSEEASVSNMTRGSYVSHAKLLDLGSGEIMSSEKGVLRIRFAAGERAFSVAAVAPHLTVTLEAPVFAPPKPVRERKARAKAPARKLAAKP